MVANCIALLLFVLFLVSFLFDYPFVTLNILCSALCYMMRVFSVIPDFR